jgi:hypothetical protein
MTACTRCETALEDGDLRCAVCALPVPQVARAGELPRHAQVLRCCACGAAVGFSAAVQAPRCGFCGHAMAIEQPVDPIETARLRVPFTVDRATAEAALRGWLGRRGWFAPPALASEAVLESLAPLSWAAWLVNAGALVTWTADSDAGARRSAWAPHAGQARLEFRDIIVPASRGLRDTECRLLIPYYELSRGVVLEAMPEAVVESFDAQRSAARAHVQRSIEATAKVRIEPQIPGRRYRNVRVACLLERQTTDRIALPAWILAYRYRGAPYRAIVHGQRPEVVFGRSPIDWAKVGALAAGLAIVAAIIAVIAILAGAR